MDKLRVGIIIKKESMPTDGGRFSYQNTLTRAINEFNFHPDIEIINIIFSKKPKQNYFIKPCIYINPGYSSTIMDIAKRAVKNNRVNLIQRNGFINLIHKIWLNQRNKKAEAILKHHKIDLVYYVIPEANVINYPFITNHWDIAHKSMDAFPENYLNGTYEFREKYYLYTLNKAFLILCESETGAAELKSFYSLYPNKIKVLPIFAGNIIEQPVTETETERVLLKFNLKKEKFFLYPAQFWSYKNHYNLLLAFHKLVTETNDFELKLFLCGSDMGNFTYIKETIDKLSLKDKVILPGFISNEELSVLYKNAIALTMPTFLGPTNMPLIEAAHLKCAVLCSDLEGHKEILENHALYFEPSDFNAIYEAMKVIMDKSFRSNLVDACYNHIQHSPFNIKNSLEVLNKILLEAIPKRKVWGN